ERPMVRAAATQVVVRPHRHSHDRPGLSASDDPRTGAARSPAASTWIAGVLRPSELDRSVPAPGVLARFAAADRGSAGAGYERRDQESIDRLVRASRAVPTRRG